MIRWLVGLIGLSIGLGVAPTSALAADPTEIGIGYLGHAGTRSTLSLVEQPAENDGIAGARLAIEDNNTTGKFLNQHFKLEEIRLKDNEDAAKAATALAERNGFIIADLPADDLLKAADALRDRGTLLLNAGAADDRLREQDCRANVIHVAPTRSMLADAIAQYLVWKQWKRWLMVVGSHGKDKLYADALRQSKRVTCRHPCSASSTSRTRSTLAAPKRWRSRWRGGCRAVSRRRCAASRRRVRWAMRCSARESASRCSDSRQGSDGHKTCGRCGRTWPTSSRTSCTRS